MRFLPFHLCLVLALALVGIPQDVVAQRSLKPTVLLISIDGFRPDYLDSIDCPNLRLLARGGVRARWMKPVFPTKTFTNHYSQVTGLSPQAHGIIGNTMYDPHFDAVFSMGRRDEVRNGRWWGGEPIWVTAERQGQKAAAMFWPGSEARIASEQPSYWARYDGDITAGARVRQILDWLDYPEALRPTFMTLYFSSVDDAGHEFGPVYRKVEPAVKQVDDALGILIRGLKQRGIFEQVNILVTSDHGMAHTAKGRTIYLDDYADVRSVRLVDRGILVSAWGEPESIDSLHAKLSGAHPHLLVFRKEEIPDRWRYARHRRAAPLFIVADEGWVVQLRTDRDFWRERDKGGDHGYDNAAPSMRALFVAHGPAFVRGLVAEPIECIQLYSLMCHILDLQPAPNEGDFTTVKHLLR